MVSFIVGGYHGLGRHQQTLSADDLAGIDHAVYVQTLIAAVVGFALLKVSIAIFLLRLGGNTAWFRRTLWATVAFITVYTLFAFFSFTFRCWPISGVWDKTINAKCYSWTFFVGTALLNTCKYLHSRRWLHCTNTTKRATCLLTSFLRLYPYQSSGTCRCRGEHVWD